MEKQMHLSPHCQAVTVQTEHKEVKERKKMWEGAQSECIRMGPKGTTQVEARLGAQGFALSLHLGCADTNAQVGA